LNLLSDLRGRFDCNRVETNHERTLSVPYVFRKHLIWSEEIAPPRQENFRAAMAAAKDAPRRSQIGGSRPDERHS
jgi:hypothetical protein